MTPQDLSSEMLPSIEELCDAAWRVSSDGLVSQYIRAHPRPAAAAAASDSTGAAATSPLRQLKFGGRGWPTDQPEGESDYLEGLGFCRLCPEFSKLYKGHNVYICKRLAVV